MFSVYRSCAEGEVDIPNTVRKAILTSRFMLVDASVGLKRCPATPPVPLFLEAQMQVSLRRVELVFGSRRDGRAYRVVPLTSGRRLWAD